MVICYGFLCGDIITYIFNIKEDTYNKLEIEEKKESEKEIILLSINY